MPIFPLIKMLPANAKWIYVSINAPNSSRVSRTNSTTQKQSRAFPFHRPTRIEPSWRWNAWNPFRIREFFNMWKCGNAEQVSLGESMRKFTVNRNKYWKFDCWKMIVDFFGIPQTGCFEWFKAASPKSQRLLAFHKGRLELLPSKPYQPIFLNKKPTLFILLNLNQNRTFNKFVL